MCYNLKQEVQVMSRTANAYSGSVKHLKKFTKQSTREPDNLVLSTELTM